MGYDNTPGKDSGNERLYDRIGGVHAVTQEDGYPGYGGVFVESFFGFSTQPPPGIEAHPGASPIFDQIFNPLRPSTGQPANFTEVSAFVPIYAHDVCGAVGLDRQMQVNCGIVILSNLISSTMMPMKLPTVSVLPTQKAACFTTPATTAFSHGRRRRTSFRERGPA